MSELKNLRTSSKEQSKTLPAGAKVLKETANINVEEIENGFLISKSFDIQYQPKGSDHSDWLYYTKKWYSKTNPLSIQANDKSLSDVFE